MLAWMVVRGGALAAIALLLGACTLFPPGEGRDPNLVGAVYPLSGPQAPGGREELDGVRLALRMAHASGAPGYRLQVEDARTPEGARSAVDRLIDRHHVRVIVGSYGSAVSEAAAGRAQERGAVYWETGAVSEGVTAGRDHVFRTVATGANLGRIAVEFTAGVLLPATATPAAAARAVIIHVDDVYGNSVAAGERARAAELGIAVVDDIGYNPHAYDPVAIVRRLGADHADFLWDVSYLDDGIAIWRQVLAQGVRPKAAVGTSSAFCMPDFGLALGADAVGLFAADKPDEDVNPSILSERARTQLAAAQAAYAAQGHRDGLTIPVVAGFVGGWTLFHEVLPRSGAVDVEAIRRAAFALDIPAGEMINGGGIRFAGEGAPAPGQNLRAPAVVGQWQGVQNMRVVYPAGFATALPQVPIPA